MKKIPIDAVVYVDGAANQWPFERIVDKGTVLDNTGRKYLVKLQAGRENLLFKRSELTWEHDPLHIKRTI